MVNICRNCEAQTGVHCEEPDGYGETFLSNLNRYLIGTEEGRVYVNNEFIRTTNETVSACPVMLGEATPRELYESLVRQNNSVGQDVVSTDPI